MIVKLDDETFVISSQRVWLPGNYACERGARLAFRLTNARLQALQDRANERAGGTGGVITYAELAAEHRR